MIRKKWGDIEWLEFELLQEFPQLKHGVFLRHGGVSSGSFSTLNVGMHRDDNSENTLKNRRLIGEILDVPSWVICDQIHENHVAFVPHLQEGELKIADGVITNRADEGLLIRHADCQAAIFFDPITNTIANVHAGWRGNVKNIYQTTLAKMQEITGAKPENIHVCISPSLGPDRSEFINFRTELPEHFSRFQTRPTYFNLWEIGRWQLLEAGILESHMQIAQICTFDNPNDFFSFRRDKRVCGSHATVVALRSTC